MAIAEKIQPSKPEIIEGTPNKLDKPPFDEKNSVAFKIFFKILNQHTHMNH